MGQQRRIGQPLRRALGAARRNIVNVKNRVDVSRVRSDILYRNLAELVERHGGSTFGLAGYELKVFSQNGEDGVIAEALRRVTPTSRTFVEFGIGAGIEGNCVFLADVLGWQGTFIEADEELHARLEQKYVSRDAVQTICRSVTAENINEILRSSCQTGAVDVLSIDIDGNDYWVWKSIDAIDARLVVIEYNGSIDPTQALVQPYRPDEAWRSTSFFGASLAALVDLGRKKGYTLIHADLTGTNAFFVKDDLAPAFVDLDPPMLRSANYGLVGWSHTVGGGSPSYLAVGDDAVTSATPGRSIDASSGSEVSGSSGANIRAIGRNRVGKTR